MDKETRSRIQHATQAARRLLEEDYREQLEGTFDIRLDGVIAQEAGSHLSDAEKLTRDRLIAAVTCRQALGASAGEAVRAYLREAAFTTLNRFVALKMLEARALLQECVSMGEVSSGFKEFTALAPGLVQLPDHCYRLYIERLFDEIGREVRVLFDRRDPASLLWPRRQALLDLLGVLNAAELSSVWGADETIGWVYQYFNGDDERRQMRAESQAPRSSRELAVRNQFFTPRYVVQFLTDNSLGRTWREMRGADTQLAHLDYLVKPEEGFEERSPKDPRDLRVLDPACGSGHFLLYAFDLLLTIYEEAWADEWSPASESTGQSLRRDYPEIEQLRAAVPALVLCHNLHGIDIDARAAQIASLALWMRAQRAYDELGITRSERLPITRSNIAVAEPMPGERSLRQELIGSLGKELAAMVERVFSAMEHAGELGTLLRIEDLMRAAIREVYPETGGIFGRTDEEQWAEDERGLLTALEGFAEHAQNGAAFRRKLFTDDTAQGIAFIDLCRERFDVVLMNPPFGAASLAAKKEFESAYPRTKNDVYAAFVERGIELLHPTGYLGAITSRTGFFLSSFQKWREEILLKEAPPTVFADLGQGVLDSAMVEVAAYCLRKKKIDLGLRDGERFS
jgi:23S rRNA G2445 N2-methylase RlmL